MKLLVDGSIVERGSLQVNVWKELGQKQWSALHEQETLEAFLGLGWETQEALSEHKKKEPFVERGQEQQQKGG